jgi:hypothetical protein
VKLFAPGRGDAAFASSLPDAAASAATTVRVEGESGMTVWIRAVGGEPGVLASSARAAVALRRRPQISESLVDGNLGGGGFRRASVQYNLLG